MLVGVKKEFAITEIAAEQAKFPEMVGDVFADVAHRAIGTHDNLGIFVWLVALYLCQPGAQQTQSFLSVLNLGLLIVASNDYPRRHMSYSYSRILFASPRCRVCIDANLFGIDRILRSACTFHHPATGIFALCLVIKDAMFFQFFERRIPEMQVKNFALPREEVVLDAQPLHGFEVAAENGGGDQVGDLGGFVSTLFDG